MANITVLLSNSQVNILKLGIFKEEQSIDQKCETSSFSINIKE